MLNNMPSRYELHKEYIADVCLEISQASYWRALLFSSDYYMKIIIDLSSLSYIPDYVKDAFQQHSLKYYVSKVTEPSKKFDIGLEIFKFEACEYPDLIRYSGNNSDVI